MRRAFGISADALIPLVRICSCYVMLPGMKQRMVIP
jgi:hypothetical protein